MAHVADLWGEEKLEPFGVGQRIEVRLDRQSENQSTECEYEGESRRSSEPEEGGLTPVVGLCEDCRSRNDDVSELRNE